MKAKCKKCGDIVEVTRPKEFKSCKCGAIALDYGDEYYYRVCGAPEDFDGEIEDAPELKERAGLTDDPEIRFTDDPMERAMGIIGEENIGGESGPRNLFLRELVPEEKDGKIIKTIWGGDSTDDSVCGIVAVKYMAGVKLFFGSRAKWTTDREDAEHIVKHGSEITKETLESFMNLLKGE